MATRRRTYKDPGLGFTAVENAKGLLLCVNDMGAVLDGELNTTSDLFAVFGLCEKKVTGEGSVYPAILSHSGTDELSLLPTDQWPGYLFFDYDDPTNVEVPKAYEGSRKSWVLVTVKLDIILYCNLVKIGLTSKWGADYRVVKEALKTTVLKAITRNLYKVPGSFSALHGNYEPKAVHDRDLKDVFKGYTVDEKTGQYLQFPNYGFRLEGELTYRHECQ
jgi:hypothetical protein